MPELREAEVALLATLAKTDELKASIAQRKRRLDLQTAYGQALLWSKGFAAEERRKRPSTAPANWPPWRGTPPRSIPFAMNNPTRGFIGGDMEIGEGNRGGLPARRRGWRVRHGGRRRSCILGSVCLFQGDLGLARTPSRARIGRFRARSRRGGAITVRHGYPHRRHGLPSCAFASAAPWVRSSAAGSLDRRGGLARDRIGPRRHPRICFRDYQTIIEARRGDSAAALDAAERLAPSHPGARP